jgi:peptidyl-prolyl cis-trans isomerase B (cyclophilin B)
MKKYIAIVFVLSLVIAGCSSGNDVILNVKDSDIELKKDLMQDEAVNKEAATTPDISTSEAVPMLPSFLRKDADATDILREQNDKVIMKTNLGDITIALYNDDAPNTVENFLYLASKNFYDGVKFHRIIKDFMIQGGDPNSKNDDWSTHGTGGPGYKFADEINTHKLVKGSLAMANSGPGTNGSQFFIVTAAATPWLDGLHTNFGEVTDGWEVVEAIEAMETNGRDHPLTDVVIKDIELISASK